MINREQMAERLKELERKVDFIFQLTSATIAVGSPLDPAGPKIIRVPFAKLYQEVRGGATIVDVSGQVADPAGPDSGPGSAPASAGESTAPEGPSANQSANGNTSPGNDPALDPAL